MAQRSQFDPPEPASGSASPSADSGGQTRPSLGPAADAKVFPTSRSARGDFWEVACTLWAHGWLAPLFLFALTVFAYGPCLGGGFVWDDDAWTLKLVPLFKDLSGLATIWTKLTALQQYYPLTATTFWVDYNLWGLWTLPYHLENLLLHLAAGCLFWRLLKHLEVPGAGLAATIFLLHPLCVESAAWITERKNVLSLTLFLAALLAYGRSRAFWQRGVPNQALAPGEASLQRRYYILAFCLFLAAYLAKATAFALPAVLLLISWWRQPSLRWRRDVLPTLPFFAVTLCFGLVTSWLERTHVGAEGPEWEISFGARCLIAGRALWFYAGRLIWPTHLCFIYPRWQMDAAAIRWWLYPASAIAVIVLLWALRNRIGRGPLTAVLFYVGTLFPLLGFINGYFMRYSFVCDHWAYLPSLGLIALGAALLTRLAGRLHLLRASYVFLAMILPLLVLLTKRQCAMYSDIETLYRTAIASNPDADLAHNNLGLLLFQAGEAEEAIGHFQKAVDLRPTSAHAHNNLANALRVTGRLREAAAHYEASLKIEPDNASTANNLAQLLSTSWDASLRDGPRAVEIAQHANSLTKGQNLIALGTLASAYAEAGRFEEAIQTAQAALEKASKRSNNPLIEVLDMQLKLYQAHSPFHEPSPTDPMPDGQPK